MDGWWSLLVGTSRVPRTRALMVTGTLMANAFAPDGSAVPTICQLTLADEELLPLIAERTLACGARLYALTPRHMSLEQLFLEVIGSEDSGQ